MNDGYHLSYDISPDLAHKLILAISRRNTTQALGKYAQITRSLYVVVGSIAALTVALLLKENPAFAVLMFLLGYAVCLFKWKRAHAKSVDSSAKLMALNNEQRTRVDIGTSGLQFDSSLGNIFMTWAAITEIWHMDGATIIKSGAQSFALPDEALPEGVSADQFEDQLKQWKSAY